MAFSDLITKDVATPLAGFDKAVATGFELAQNQEKISLAQQQNQLAREQLNASFIDKATGLLPHLTKATGKAKGILVRSYSDLMAKAGMPVNEELQALLSSDENVAANFSQNILMLNKKYPPGTPNREMLIHAELGELTGQSASDIYSGQLGLAKSKMAITAQAQRQEDQTQRIIGQAGLSRQTVSLRNIGEELNKRGADTQKEIDTLIRNTSMVEEAVKKNSLSAFNKTLGQQAKTAGTVGALSDYETRLQAPSGLEVMFAQGKKFITGESKIPEYVRNQITEQVSAMKKTASDLVTNRNIGLIVDRSSDPIDGPAYTVMQDKAGNLQLGYAAARLLNANNRALRSLKQDAQTLDLNAFLKKQTTPMTSEQILNLIKDAYTGNILDKKTNQPTGKKYIIKFSPESILEVASPVDITGSNPYLESGFQDQTDGEGE